MTTLVDDARSRGSARAIATAILLLAVLSAPSLDARERDSALICGNGEKYLLTAAKPIWLFTRPAARPPPRGAVLAPELTVSDGVTLRGLLVPASEPPARRKALVVLYGVVHYSDFIYELLRPLEIFDPHYDVYIYDYRGYWRSDGTPRFRALVDDVDELLANLATRYDEIRIYGVSLGSLIASRAADNEKVASIFLDSVVSRLSSLSKLCRDKLLDPVDMSEATCRKVTLLIGRYDSLFPLERAEPFVERMKGCGNAHVSILADLGHPFSEGAPDGPRATALRATMIRRWLANDAPQGP